MMSSNFSARCDLQEKQGRVFEIKKYLNRCVGTWDLSETESEEYGGAKAARKRLLSAGGDFHVIGT